MDKFMKLGLHKRLANGISSLGFVRPTNVQAKAIPALLEKEKPDILIAAPTGTGKTIVYLSSLINRIYEVESKSDGAARMTLPGRPRAVVLVPTRELGEQVLTIAKTLSAETRFRAAGILGSMHLRTRNTLTKKPMDLLVATPGSFLEMFQSSRRTQVFLSHVSEVVLDEADILLTGKGFPLIMEPILKVVKAKKDARLVYIGASVPKKLIGQLEKEHGRKLRIVRDVNLHKVWSQNVFAEFIRIKKHESRFTELRTALQKGKKMIIFCNTSKACQYLGYVVGDLGYSYELLYGGLPKEKRSENWNNFRNGFSDCLICTDIGSRGLDDPNLDIVFMYDVPFTSDDYLHRVGRLRGNGTVIVLVDKRSVNFARTLFLHHVKGEAMEDVEALNFAQTEKEIMHSDRRRGSFRVAVEPEKEDFSHRRDKFKSGPSKQPIPNKTKAQGVGKHVPKRHRAKYKPI